MRRDGQHLHILVIDDSPDILALKQEILEDEGFRVTVRIPRHIDMEGIRHLAPHLIILDDTADAALGLLKALPVDAQLSQVLLVLCTGAIRRLEPIRPELDARGVTVMQKPFDIDELVRVVRVTLGLPPGQ